ncbi:hypothetical protein [Sphingomonas parapaucimobilis]|uniref:hypothetical protein n=1 Tax=Sphingomonas parapaucimobilis TaxID=28213 RepID=UPI000AEDFC15|nr:hypothetical protein [Sphingomonas parapaucimobilis]
MSLGVCIPGMVERGEITPTKGEEMARLFDTLEQDFRRQFGDQAAAAMATDAALATMEREALRKKRLALGQVQAQKRMLVDMGGFAGRDPMAAGPLDPRAAVALFDRDGRAGYSNVEGRRKAIRARAFGMIDGLLARHHTDPLGRIRNKAELGDLVRELFGEDSGNLSARELATAWTDAAEMLRQRFNAAGGAIGKLEGWGLPQAHDTRAIRAAGYESWRNAILPGLDRQRMVDDRTGLPFSDGGLELALRDVFETIRTEGWNKRSAGQAGGKSLANSRADHRFLIFKSADAWMDYQDAFGVGTAFDAMTGHIDGMARDIAMMEILGPNPAASVRWLKDTLERQAALDTAPDSRAVDRAFGATRKIDRLYDEITGAAGRPENRTMALAFSSVRSLQTAAKLGSATLSAVTDVAFQGMTRRFNGLASTTILPGYVKMFRPGAVADQRQAVRLLGIADEWSKRAGAQQRILGEELTGDVARRLAEGTLRVSGLSRWTEAGRWAFGMEFLGHITDQVDRPYAQLNSAFRGALDRYGINAAGWDSIRKTPLERDRGAFWLKPDMVEDRELGDRLYEMILSETDYAVPTADLRTRALVNSVAPKGNFFGEMVRSAALFKGFGISLLIMQGRRIMDMSGWSNRALYSGGLVLTTTLMGGLVLQLKALAGGKDPRPMDDQKFWGAAVLQGGGFGIFGDFLQSTTNRFDGGFAGTLAGPLAGDAQKLAELGQPVADVLTGTRADLAEKHLAATPWKAARLARAELPGGSLWYARLAFDRMLTDQIQAAIDPNYTQSWSRMEKRARDQRTNFWWAPGDMIPDRSPELSNVYLNEGADQ